MKEFDFELIYKLENNEEYLNNYIDILFERGFDGATISTREPDIICFSFTRKAVNISKAIQSAKNDISKAIPTAKQLEIREF